ncbi:C45 family autoproteolytic acyltransferase/hydrolase [Ralstonia syzygii subsp. celebesensis]|uniref:Peptidase C45 n=2 Tax=Ralstonia syzygii subsp. celebesensis TaxID=1310168 RepID=A0A1U9VKJ8_9RALS|nr:C45 family peptidase [Ralstonia syzygii]AQW31209.1 peptidase C45 [blood disease bacterium A2-HR MARDI]QQV55005.1 C45 family peptidase [Ralstonia syzygii subsp. celebesensis]CCA81953.1 conserved hypothethical protein [blood disease bacterium R229]
MPSLAFVDISGSPFEAGQALGRFGTAAVHQHLLHTEAWHSVMRWRGSPLADAMAALVRERFPRIWAELQGLADGLQLPLEEVFLWNCRGDVWAATNDGCTTVQLPGADQRRIAHNEDGDPGFAGHCALAQCHIDGSPGFAAFVYPGSLPGHTFAVTDAGLTMTVNNLRLREVATGVPRMVLTRAVLDAADLDAAVWVLRESPRAGGFHLTLGHCAHPALLSVEFGAHGCSALEISEPSLHANHAIHPAMRDVPQVITDSSRHRQVRGDALLAESRAGAKAIDPLAILADQGDAALPIYRADPHDPDNENTLATANIAILPTHIEWAVYEHPGSPARYRMVNGHQQTEVAPQG